MQVASPTPPQTNKRLGSVQECRWAKMLTWLTLGMGGGYKLKFNNGKGKLKKLRNEASKVK